MNILYVSFWGINDGLTQSTVIPNVEILRSIPEVGFVKLVTLERFKNFQRDSVDHQPIYIGGGRLSVRSFLRVRSSLLNSYSEDQIDLVIARTSLAGVFGRIIASRRSIPFVVESFEPHHEYMRELGVWSSLGLPYNFLKWSSKIQKKEARYLIPLTNSYKKKLIAEGVPSERIRVVPCAVDHNKFLFNQKEGTRIRKLLNVKPKEILGVYLGKFGDIYLDTEAFEIFKKVLSEVPEFRLLIITPQNHDEIRRKLDSVEFDLEKCNVLTLSHELVPSYLSACDFAFSLIRPSENRKYCSPIKNGEYWAIGLPIVVTQGVGDDSDLIEEQEAGIVIRETLSGDNIDKLLERIEKPNLREEIRKLAIHYRSTKTVKRVYKEIITHSV